MPVTQVYDGTQWRPIEGTTTDPGGHDHAGLYLPLSGGTLTGFLNLHADPTALSHAATKQYVDNNAGVSDHALLTNIQTDDHHARYTDVEAQAAVDGIYLKLTGGTLTGGLEIDIQTGVTVRNNPGAGSIAMNFASAGDTTARLRLGGNITPATSLSVQFTGNTEVFRLDSDGRALFQSQGNQRLRIDTVSNDGGSGVIEWYVGANGGVKRRAYLTNVSNNSWTWYRSDGGTAFMSWNPANGGAEGGVVVNQYSGAPASGKDQYWFQLRNITVSDSVPGAGDGINGDVWLQYA